MSTIDLQSLYKHACDTPSDINQHLPVLKQHASRCAHVTEMGARTGNSTIAFMAANVEAFVSYDYQYNTPEAHLAAGVERLKRLIDDVASTGADVKYIGANVLDIEIQPTDMLFIDTWHVYEQLKQELQLHAHKVRKYIAFHDTHAYGVKGEGYLHADAKHPTRDKLNPQGGIRPAIDEFLQQHTCWSITYETHVNNGLIIITKQ